MTPKVKKILPLIILSILLLLILASILIVSTLSKKQEKSKAFTNQIITQMAKTDGQSHVSESIQRNLDTITNSTKSDKDKYLALQNLLFYYSAEYSKTKNPELRKYAMNSIGGYASTSFPKLYSKENFEIPCADPSCGEDLDNDEKAILEKINKSGLSDYVKETIIINYKTASYTPISNSFDKKMGMSLVVSQLTRYNDPIASQAAQDLKNYLYNKYKMQL
jgi:hypothetical protein